MTTGPIVGPIIQPTIKASHYENLPALHFRNIIRSHPSANSGSGQCRGCIVSNATNSTIYDSSLYAITTSNGHVMLVKGIFLNLAIRDGVQVQSFTEIHYTSMYEITYSDGHTTRMAGEILHLSWRGVKDNVQSITEDGRCYAY